MKKDLVDRLRRYSAERQGQGGITAEAADAIEELLAEIKTLEDLLKQNGTEKKTCKTCGNDYQMICLNMPACTAYKEFTG